MNPATVTKNIFSKKKKKKKKKASSSRAIFDRRSARSVYRSAARNCTLPHNDVLSSSPRINSRYTRYAGWMPVSRRTPGTEEKVRVGGSRSTVAHVASHRRKEPAISSCTTMQHYAVLRKQRRTRWSLPRLSQFTI